MRLEFAIASRLILAKHGRNVQPLLAFRWIARASHNDDLRVVCVQIISVLTGWQGWIFPPEPRCDFFHDLPLHDLLNDAPFSAVLRLIPPIAVDQFSCGKCEFPRIKSRLEFLELTKTIRAKLIG